MKHTKNILNPNIFLNEWNSSMYLKVWLNDETVQLLLQIATKILTEYSNTWKHNDTFPYKYLTSIYHRFNNREKKLKIKRKKSQMPNIDV